MLKIDIHTHILPKTLPRWSEQFGYGGFIELEHHKPCGARMLRDGKFFREIESNAWDPLERLQDCDRARVDVQVLSTVPVMFSYGAKPAHGLQIAQFLNDQLAETVAAHPTRFLGLGTLPMQDPDLAAAELTRCMRTLGFCGAQIGTHVNGANLDDAKFHSLWRTAEQLGAAIFVHPWDMLAPERMQKYWLPWLVGMPAELSLAICAMIFGGVFEKFPRLRVAFAHGGGAFPGTLGRIDHGFDARPDLCAIDNSVSPRASVRKFFVDSLVHDAATLRHLIQLFGADRIALGTDYPFPLGETAPGSLIESLPELDERARAQLLGETALAWLGKKSTDFRVTA